MRVDAQGFTKPASDIVGLPVVGQVLLGQIRATDCPYERLEIHGRMASYIARHAHADIPQSATEALNRELATMGLPAVVAPVSALQASFANMLERAQEHVKGGYSAHTGRYEKFGVDTQYRRQAFLDDLRARVAGFGKTLTAEELRDAAVILDRGMRQAGSF